MTKKCILPKAITSDIYSCFACRCFDYTDDMIYYVVSITDQSEFYDSILVSLILSDSNSNYFKTEEIF